MNNISNKLTFLQKDDYMNNFITRTFLDSTGLSFSFEDVMKNNISVVLGEPASGKTYQFKQYQKENKDTVIKIDLVNIDDFHIEAISSNIKVILFDSIDEALENSHYKQISSKIKNIRNAIKDKNLNINISISCRYFEWKEYYKKDIEINENEEIKIYYIQDLEKNDINKLLEINTINQDEFWKWIKSNNLDGILKNILLLTNIFKKFDIYKNKTQTINLYEEIILDYLSMKGYGRELNGNFKTLGSEDKLAILSSLATYMSLNYKSTIDKSYLDKLDKNLFKIKDIKFDQQKIETLLASSLFKNEDEKISFNHKSFQEFLSAYFLNLKNIDFETIKNIFGNKYGFYNEYEEIITYLSELNDKLFDNFVRFDPFVFRRNKGLDEIKQKVLVKSIIDYTQDSYLRTKVKQFYLKDSSLNKIDLPNVENIFKECVDINNITVETYQYIVGIFNYKYTEELEKYILEIWNIHLMNKEKLVLFFNSDNFKNLNDKFENIKYSEILLDYIVANNLIDESIDILKYRIFISLYGKVDFNKLLPILKSKISFHALSLYHNMVIKLDCHELVSLFKVVSSEKDIQLDNQQLTILILSILKNHQILHTKIQLNEIDFLINKTNMNFELIYSDDEFNYYKNISFENLAVENKTIQVPLSVMRFIYHIPRLSLENKTNTQDAKNILTFEEITKKLKYWIENPTINLSDEFYSIMRDEIKSIELIGLEDFNQYLIDIHDKENELLNIDIKNVVLQFLTLDKDTYNYIKKYWEKDYINNYIYFRYMLKLDVNNAISDFRERIFNNTELTVILDKFKENKDFDNQEIEYNLILKIKYLFTSMNFIYIPKRQHNFLVDIKNINDENLKFIIEKYDICFHDIKNPNRGYWLDEYAEMYYMISQTFDEISLDIQRIKLLEDLVCKTENIKIFLKDSLEKLYNLRNKEERTKNYKDILDNYEINNKKILLEDLHSCACKILDKQKILLMEDPISVEFRDLLNASGYNVSDQGKGGESATGKSFGERDLIFKNEKGDIVSFLEAIKVKGFKKSKIDEHYQKLIKNYDFLGNKENYMLVYYFGNNFDDFWIKYKKNFDSFEEIKNSDFDKSNIKICNNFTKRGTTVFHVILNFVLDNNKVNK